ncbi:MAG: LysM peptidoglycan-binding domain-containing protein [Cellvibrionaceae bacterium]
MHLRKLTLAIGLLGGALCSNLAYSLGLGEITLKSALDEPLNAEIKLLQVRELTSGEIIIGLASIDDFKRAGVDRVFFLQDLKFEVLLNNPGGPIVKVTSRKPVQEPYVNFLVQTRWPSGRLLREYTLLLDIPVFADKPARAVQPARTITQSQPAPLPAPVRPSQPQVTQTQEVVTPQPVRPSAPSASQPTYSADEYEVRPNDTLWEIALQVRPNRNVSVQQTMVALQRVNPNAFINDNINLLKKGQILKIPDQNEIENIQQREAIGSVAYQNDQWSGGDNSSGAQLEGSSATTSTDSDSDEPRGQLTLAAPSDIESSGQSSGSGDASQENAGLENELSVNLEELDSARRESDELNTRVGELDEQIDTIERLIDVSSEEMRALQLAAENTAEDVSDAGSDLVESGTELIDETTDEIGDTLSEAGDSLVDLSSDLISDSTDLIIESDQVETELDSIQEEVDVAVVEPVVEAPKVVTPAVQSKSFMDIIMDNLWYIIGAIVALIAGAGFFMHRKAQAEMAAFDELDDELYEDNNFGDFENADSDEDDHTETEETNYDLDSDDEETQLDLEEDQESAIPTESETGDAVGEADIYIAYGKFDQAEEMLQRAIIADPNNVPARLKLLEVYSETKDVEKFDTEYAQLIDLKDSSANKEAEELRSRIPNAGEFSIGAAAIAATTAAGAFAGDLTDKLDFGEDGSNASGLADTADSLDGASEGLDLDSPSVDATDFGDISLDFDSEESASDSAVEESLELDVEATSSALTEEASDFELDLDLDDLESAVSSEDLIAESGDDLGGIDFELDLEDSAGAQDSAAKISEEVEADTLGLTLDLDDSNDDVETALPDDDDFLSDLEFTAGSQPAESTPLDEGASPAENTTLDDAFDLDMDDMDLAALDEEMDALVGDLDETELTAPSVDSATKLAEGSIGDLEVPESLELSESATDLDDMISLDEPSLDELSVEGDLSESLSDDIEAASVDSLSYEEGGDVDDELGSELDFLADTDEVATKLDLARAYIDMGDTEGAKDILEEVVSEGNDEQKTEAQELIGRI